MLKSLPGFFQKALNSCSNSLTGRAALPAFRRFWSTRTKPCDSILARVTCSTLPLDIAAGADVVGATGHPCSSTLVPVISRISAGGEDGIAEDPADDANVDAAEAGGAEADEHAAGDGGAATDTADEALSVDIVEAIGVRDEARAAEEGGAAAGTDAEATPVNDAEADGRDDGVHAAGGAEPGGIADAS